MIRSIVTGMLWLGLLARVLGQGVPLTRNSQTAKPLKFNGRYANMPRAAMPFRRFAAPYHAWFLSPKTLRVNDHPGVGTGRIQSRRRSVRIGFLGPIQPGIPDQRFGEAMLHGAELAVEEANAHGGYSSRRGGPPRPYVLEIHNDLPLWGASDNEVTGMIFRQHVMGMLGSVGGTSTHIALRVSLKLDLPIVNTATSDPTLTETRVPWLLRDFPDDRQQGYALAHYIFHRLQLRRIAVLRVVNRYGRMGVLPFENEALREGHPPVVELTFRRGERHFLHQLRIVRASHAQGVLLWGEAPEAARILKQMRALNIHLPVFGGNRLDSRQLLRRAGTAANGLVIACALSPDLHNPQWIRFHRRYQRRFHHAPNAYAARAFDGMNILIQSIQQAGLNRGRIMQALLRFQMRGYSGVSGYSFFDHTLNDIAPITLATVQQGRFVVLQKAQQP